MQEQDANVSAILPSKGTEKAFVRYRDVVKYAHGMQLAIFGIENQDKNLSHYRDLLRGERMGRPAFPGGYGGNAKGNPTLFSRLSNVFAMRAG